MIRKLLCAFMLLAVVPVAVKAQNKGKILEVTQDTVRSNLQDKFIQQLGDSADEVVSGVKPNSNWFVSVAGGINAIAAEKNREYDKFFNRMRGYARVSAGTWITPMWGVRFHVGYGRLAAHYEPFHFYNMYDSYENHQLVPEEVKPYLSTKDGEEWFHRKFNYMDCGLEVMTDVVRWFTKEPKRIGFYLFAGPGFSHTFKNQGISPDNSFAFKAAMQLNIKIVEHWDIFAEVDGTIVDESFDGQIDGLNDKVNRTMEGYAGITLGVSYRFGGKKFKKYTLVNPVVYENVYRMLPPPVAPVQKVEVDDAMSSFTVRFFIDQYNIEPDQMLNIQRVARYLKKHPGSQLSLTGYADRETAYPSYNMKLSQRRVNSVRQYLIDECKVDPSRMVSNAKGDTQRAFNEDYRWNRAVVLKIIESEK